MEEISLKKIIQQIKSNPKIASLPRKDLDVWESELKKHIASLTDEEDLAFNNIYLLVFLMRTKKISEKNANFYYEKIINYISKKENKYKNKIHTAKNKIDRQGIYYQMIYFYKITELNMAYLENQFAENKMKNLAERAYGDKISLFKREQLSSGRLGQYLSYSALLLRHFLRKNVILYGILSYAGIMFLWVGGWGTIEWLIFQLGVPDIYTYLISSTCGILILLFLGIFYDQTFGGTKESLEEMEKIESSEIKELKEVEKLIRDDYNN